MKNILLLSILQWFVLSIGIAQNLPTRTVILNEDTLVTKVDVFISNVQTEIDKDLSYYSYYNNELHQTQGAYSGHLTHGRYAIYNKDNKISTLGYFDFGLKHGVWKNWYSNGQLKEVENWSYGEKSGFYEAYHANGQLNQKGRFKNNKMDGKLYMYENDTIASIQKWSKGEIVQKIKRTKEQKNEATDNKQNLQKRLFGKKKGKEKKDTKINLPPKKKKEEKSIVKPMTNVAPEKKLVQKNVTVLIQDKDNKDYLSEVKIMYIAEEKIKGKKKAKIERLVNQKGKQIYTNKQGKVDISLLPQDYVLFISKSDYEPQEVRLYQKDKRSSLLVQLIKEQRCITLRGKVLYEEDKQAIYQAEVRINNITNPTKELIYTNPKGLFEYCLNCRSKYELMVYDSYFGDLVDTIDVQSYCGNKTSFDMEFILKAKLKASIKTEHITQAQKPSSISDPFMTVVSKSKNTQKRTVNISSSTANKTTSSDYQVVVGTFSVKKNAKKRLEEVKVLGFEQAIIKPNQSNSLYSVCIGTFANQAAAIALKDKMIDQHQMKAYVGRF